MARRWLSFPSADGSLSLDVYNMPWEPKAAFTVLADYYHG